MRIACFTLLLVAGGGCRAAFIDERPGGAPGSSELTGIDLGAGTEVATGSFGGRAGHLGTGDVTLYSYPGGITEVRFAANFFCTDVPGPVVVLSPRDTLGTQLDPLGGDLDIAPLRASAGSQSYFVRGDATAEHNVFVFCRPYGVEVARAPMK